MSVAEICLKAGISQATYFNWKKYADMLPPEMKKLKQLEDKIEKIVADLTLDREMFQDVIRRKALKPARKREVVKRMCRYWAA
ncbi:putative transposase [Rhizobium azibense]|nr:putative transposase [Rhizobium azibense]